MNNTGKLQVQLAKPVIRAGTTQAHRLMTSGLSKNSQIGNRDAFLNYEVCMRMRTRLKTLSTEEQPSHDYSSIFLERTIQNRET